MVLNLLRNSIEAVPSGGQVELRLEQRASGLRLEVADNGPGFPASTLAAAGLPIASSKQRGFGLGLYPSRPLRPWRGFGTGALARGGPRWPISQTLSTAWS
jgi:C4-dicarboxylate-specific signal transduction histidine kinase